MFNFQFCSTFDFGPPEIDILERKIEHFDFMLKWKLRLCCKYTYALVDVNTKFEHYPVKEETRPENHVDEQTLSDFIDDSHLEDDDDILYKKKRKIRSKLGQTPRGTGLKKLKKDKDSGSTDLDGGDKQIYSCTDCSYTTTFSSNLLRHRQGLCAYSYQLTVRYFFKEPLGASLLSIFCSVYRS